MQVVVAPGPDPETTRPLPGIWLAIESDDVCVSASDCQYRYYGHLPEGQYRVHLRIGPRPATLWLEPGAEIPISDTVRVRPGSGAWTLHLSERIEPPAGAAYDELEWQDLGLAEAGEEDCGLAPGLVRLIGPDGTETRLKAGTEAATAEFARDTTGLLVPRLSR